MNEFPDEISVAKIYESVAKTPVTANTTPRVITWNIRFGSARFPFYGDSCGDKVIAKKDDIKDNLDNIAAEIISIDPDIILLQEVDMFSKRSGYINQIQYLLDNTTLNYGCYASIWQADFIPNYGLGRVDLGNAILSKYELNDAERIQLQLRTDQSDLVQYFYLRRNILKVKIPNLNLYAINIHATAFATDDTKQKHIEKYKEVLEDLDSQNFIFVTGGDLNSVPPGADVTDFCMDDICSDESFHTDADGGPHREGSYFNNFVGEPDLVQPFYDSYFEAINLESVDASEHFTHSPWNTISDTTEYWDRKLDYLFTNYQDWSTTGETHNNIENISDHAPVSATLKFP